MPLDVNKPGQMEAVFERITEEWSSLDFVVHSIAFSPKEALQGRVVDVSREGFATTMHGAFGGAAHAQRRHPLHHVVLRQPDGR
jgi:enoyl-[acyl-carrier-protein] reductase (NADH)